MVGKTKVTWMKLTTKPLDKEENFSQVMRALCSLPGKSTTDIQVQPFDEKSKETFTIKVVCCSPADEVAAKICTKKGGAIMMIEYDIENPMALEKPKEEEKPKPAPAAALSSRTI